MLHVQHPTWFPLALLLVGCPSSPPPQPPQPPVTNLSPPREDVVAPSPPRDVPPLPPPDVARATSTEPLFWHDAYPGTPLPDPRATELRAIARDPTHRASAAAAFVLGRRVRRPQFETVLGELPEARLEDFARGAVGRAPDDGPSALGRLAPLLDRPSPSPVVAALVQRFRLPLGGLHGLPTRWLASADLGEQMIGARLAAAPDADSISPAVIAGLHPIALSLLARSFKDRAPDVRHGFEAQALTLLGERVALHPRSWANAFRTLLETADFTDPSVRLALEEQVLRIESVRIDPPSVNAAFRCAVAVTADRWISGDRVMRCAEGTERWRSLAARAERIGTETPPRDPVARLNAILREGGGDVRVMEAVARVATRAEGASDPTILQTLARSNEPGVLSELLEGLTVMLDRTNARTPALRRAVIDRFLTAALRQRVLRAPFDLPEEAAIEARAHAIDLIRRLGEPMPAPAGSSRAIQSLLRPDAGITPDPTTGTAPETIARLRVRTSAGSFVIRLRGDTAPRGVQITLNAARAGRYRGTSFHRVVPWFVAQGGDPRGDGYGGTDRITPTEVSGERFARGAIGVPLGGLDSGGMQVFVMLADAPYLDARYPWIGEVTEGMTTVDRLMIGDVIEEVTVLEP